jgi:bleomycin hydrolase
MKKIVILFLFINCIAQSQEYVTNSPQSNYQFKKIAHWEATPVESQGYTGTCWSFSALSFFESEMIRKGNKNPDPLSEMYIVRKAFEGKAEKFLRLDGKTNFEQGGAFHDIPWVFDQYGVVPNQVYNGNPYGLSEHNHREMFSALNGYVNGILSYTETLSRGATLSPFWKAGFVGVLDAYLGEDPQKFNFKGKSYTPLSYAKETGLNMGDYISITSFTHHPLYQECMLAIQDNWLWGKSYNVTLEELKQIAVYALENGYTIAWGADVSEKGFNFRQGLAIVPEDESTIEVAGQDNRNFFDAGAEKKSNAFLYPTKEQLITPELRQAAYNNKTTTDDHGMHITGLYEEANGTRYYLVKNSWGTTNYPEGNLYVSENYFAYKTINIYIHKDALPKEIQKKLKL